MNSKFKRYAKFRFTGESKVVEDVTLFPMYGLDDSGKTDGTVLVYLETGDVKFTMKLSDLESRLSGDWTTLEKDYEILLKDGQPFASWDIGGLPHSTLHGSAHTVALPTGVLPRPRSLNKVHINVGSGRRRLLGARDRTEEEEKNPAKFAKIQTALICLKQHYYRLATNTLKPSKLSKLWYPKDGELVGGSLINLVFVGEFPGFTEAIMKLTLGKRHTKGSYAWLNYEVATKAPDDYVLLSENAFKLYKTYIRKVDLARLRTAQIPTQGMQANDTWLRTYPPSDAASDFEDACLGGERKDDDKAHYSGELRVKTSTTIFRCKPNGGERLAPASLMHSASANVFAHQLWPGETEVIGEWLHRSGHQFGEVDGCPSDSAFNLIFGTYQANREMLRVETLIHTSLVGTKDLVLQSKGSIHTTAKTDKAYFTMDSSGEQTVVDPPSTKKYGWLCPALEYQGHIEIMAPKLSECSLDLNFSTEFKPFSVYLSLNIEGELDRLALEQFILENLSGKKKVKTGYSQHNDNNTSNPFLMYASLPSPMGGAFARVRSIDLFGLPQLRAEFWEWQGPPPPDVEMDGGESPRAQRATLESLSLAQLFPDLSGTPLQALNFRDVSVTYQNYEFDSSMNRGLSIRGYIVIDQSFGSIYDFLTNVLHLTPGQLLLEMTLNLGFYDEWDRLPQPSTWSMEGVFLFQQLGQHKGLKICDGVTMSKIGLRMRAVQRQDPGYGGKKHISHGYTVFGDLELDILPDQPPLNLSCAIDEFGGDITLSAELDGEIWKGAFGLDIDLRAVCVSASFGCSAPLSSLQFRVGALFKGESFDANFSGVFGPKGNFSLTAVVDDFEVAELIKSFSGQSISLPDVHFWVDQATVKISNSGLSIDVAGLEVGDYAVEAASFEISTTGIELKGEIGEVKFETFGVSITDAVLTIAFEKDGSSSKSEVLIGGSVEIDGLESLPKITAGVHLYKESGEELQWTLYGSFEALGLAPSLGKLIAPLEGTFLEDVTLNEVAIIVSSKDSPVLSKLNKGRYTVKKGIQICAGIGKLAALEGIMTSEPTLVLDAAWSKSSGFSIGIQLSLDSYLELGHGITTEPIKLCIQTHPVALLLQTGFHVSVPESPPQVLRFFGLATITPGCISLGAKMESLWVNPFGFSKAVSIGPLVSFEGMYPAGLGFSGEIKIGEIKGKAALKLSEDPRKQLIYGELQDMNIQHVVRIARDLTEKDIPMPPADLLEVKKVKFYFSTGGSGVDYPAGFSFDSNIILFGKSFKGNTSVSKSGLKAKAEFDDIEIGPLAITGYKGKKALFDLDIEAATQKLDIDGGIRIDSDLHVALLLTVEILPKPNFIFNFLLNFTNLLTFKVDARMEKQVTSFRDLSKLDFLLHAVFEQELLDHILDEVVKVLESAKTDGPRLSRDLEEAIALHGAEVNSRLETLEQALVAAEAKYAERRLKAQEDHDNKMVAYNKLKGQKLIEMEALDKGVQGLEQDIRAKEAESTVNIKKADLVVAEATSQLTNYISKARQEVEKLENALKAEFGEGLKKLESYQFQLFEKNQLVSIYDRKIEGSSGFERFCYEVDRKALEGSGVVLRATISGLKTLIYTPQYYSELAKVTEAELRYKEALNDPENWVSKAKKAYDQVEQKCISGVSVARKKLEEFEAEGSKKVRQAEVALEKYAIEMAESLEEWDLMVKKLELSAEYLAVDAARAALQTAKQGSAKIGGRLQAVVRAVNMAPKDDAFKGIDELVRVLKTIKTGVRIKKVELDGSMKGFLGANGKKFKTCVKMLVDKQELDYTLDFDIHDAAKLIHEVFIRVLKTALVSVF